MSTANPLATDPSSSREDGGALDGPGFDLEGARAIAKPFLSRGHFGGRWTAEIAVNEPARQTYETLAASSKFAEGSLLVKKHVVASSGNPGPIFAMIKRDVGFFPEGGDWEYVALDGDGRLQARGKLALCARCHAEGNADWAFGLPAEAR
jgi:hypothetical protein